MLYMAIFQIAVERFQVDEVGDVGMRSGTVIALVEIIGQDFPVVISLELVCVVEYVLVEVEAGVTVLLVYTGEVFFPGDFGGFLALALVR
jgi:hypothetical protein